MQNKTRKMTHLEALYLGYEDYWAGPQAIWNNQDLEGIPGIEKGGYGQWAYSGDDTVFQGLSRE